MHENWDSPQIWLCLWPPGLNKINICRVHTSIHLCEMQGIGKQHQEIFSCSTKEQNKYFSLSRTISDRGSEALLSLEEEVSLFWRTEY